MRLINLASVFLEDPSNLPIVGGLIAIILAFLLIAVIIGLAIYVYTSLAWMKIARKTNIHPAWFAWIPVANLYQRSQMAKMHWWPLLLLIASFIPIIGPLASLVFFVFAITWTWKSFERIKRPGWWSLFIIIPILGWAVYLILLGVAAWGKD